MLVRFSTFRVQGFPPQGHNIDNLLLNQKTQKDKEGKMDPSVNNAQFTSVPKSTIQLFSRILDGGYFVCCPFHKPPCNLSIAGPNTFKPDSS